MWNCLSRKYCNRCSRNFPGLHRGYVWFCDKCNIHVAQYSCNRQGIVYNFDSTMNNVGKFHYCTHCELLILYHGKSDNHKCCKHTFEKRLYYYIMWINLFIYTTLFSMLCDSYVKKRGPTICILDLSSVMLG